MSDKIGLREIFYEIRDTRKEINERLDMMQQEIDDLKEFKNKAYGVIAVIGTFSGAIGTYIWNKISGQN